MKKCIQCGAEALELTTFEHTIEAAGRTFTATLPTLRCGKCGETYTSDADLERAELAAAKTLADSGEVSGATFRAMRHALGFNVKALAEVLGVAPETIPRGARRARRRPPRPAGRLCVAHARRDRTPAAAATPPLPAP